MADTSIAPAVVAGCIGVIGTLGGTSLALVLNGRRESRAVAMATAELVASLEEHVWSTAEGDGAALLALLHRVDIRLQSAEVGATLRTSFAAVTYSCWREASESGSISQRALNLRSALEEAIVAEVLRTGGWWRRRRTRRDVTGRVQQEALVAPPSSPLVR